MHAVFNKLSQVLACTSLLLLAAAALLLSGCQSLQKQCSVPPPQVLKVPTATYVPIDKKLTKRCAWVADGEIPEIFDVSRGRKTCLEKYEIQFDAIDQLQGAPVP